MASSQPSAFTFFRTLSSDYGAAGVQLHSSVVRSLPSMNAWTRITEPMPGPEREKVVSDLRKIKTSLSNIDAKVSSLKTSGKKEGNAKQESPPQDKGNLAMTMARQQQQSITETTRSTFTTTKNLYTDNLSTTAGTSGSSTSSYLDNLSPTTSTNDVSSNSIVTMNSYLDTLSADESTTTATLVSTVEKAELSKKKKLRISESVSIALLAGIFGLGIGLGAPLVFVVFVFIPLASLFLSSTDKE